MISHRTRTRLNDDKSRQSAKRFHILSCSSVASKVLSKYFTKHQSVRTKKAREINVALIQFSSKKLEFAQTRNFIDRMINQTDNSVLQAYIPEETRKSAFGSAMVAANETVAQ